jgi:hypothetical protein
MSLLKKIFGSSRKEIWAQIANDIGGEYKDGGFWKQDEISYFYGEWELVLDTYTVSGSGSDANRSTTYTRMRAPFVNRDEFYFQVYRSGFFSNIGKFFGTQDIEIGDSFFDEKFIIKSENIPQIKKLLSGDKIKTLINQQPEIHFEIRKAGKFFHTTYLKGMDELYFECVGELNDLGNVEKLFDLFAHTLGRLVDIDSAYAHDPNAKFV